MEALVATAQGEEMSDFKWPLVIIADPRMPRDMVLGVNHADEIVGGARRDEIEGWIIYEPEIARGMADLLNLPYGRKPE